LFPDLSTQLLSDINKDPADRIISATAVVEKAKLVTSDKAIRNFRKIATVW
jgi:PIN domain nuclease of toxin-antitoxin system